MAMVRGGSSNQHNSSFFPFTYQKITINADDTPGSNWVTAPVIITLY
jgi:hypothetical protein